MRKRTRAFGVVCVVVAALAVLVGALKACGSPSRGPGQDATPGVEDNRPAESHRYTPPRINTPSEFANKPEDSPRVDTDPVRVELIVRDELTLRPVEGAICTPNADGDSAAVTDSDGQATVARSLLANGAVVSHGDYHDYAIAPPGESEDKETLHVWLRPVKDGIGQVLDAQGEPVPDAHVAIYSRRLSADTSPLWGGHYETVSDADGSFAFPLSGRERSAVAVTDDGHRGQAIVATGAASVVIRLVEGAALNVYVEGDGAPRAKSLHLSSIPRHGSTEMHTIVREIVNGRASFPGLGPRARFELTCPEFPGAVWQVETEMPGTTTNFLIVLSRATVDVDLNWTEEPDAEPESVEVSLSGRVWRPVGEVLSPTKVRLPVWLFPLPQAGTIYVRFVAVDGRSVGFSTSSYISPNGPRAYTCDVFPLHRVPGRVTHPNGRPASGVRVSTYTYGRTAYRMTQAVTSDDGMFEVDVDSRFDVRLIAADEQDLAEVFYRPGVDDFGDITLSDVRTVRVRLEGGRDDTLYFVSARRVANGDAWPPPVGCRNGEEVKIPVSSRSRAIYVVGNGARHAQQIDETTDAYTIDLGRDGLSFRLRALYRVHTGVEVPMDFAVFRIAEGEPGAATLTGSALFVTTNEYGEAVVEGVGRGPVTVSLLYHYRDPRPPSRGVSSSDAFNIDHDGQILNYYVGVRRDKLPDDVSIIGRIAPTPKTSYPALMSLKSPLPYPMGGREIRAHGIETSIVHSVRAVAGGYTARMNPDYPYIAIRVDDERELWDNAGYLTRVGGVWRADLVVPPAPDDRAMAEIEINSAGASITSQRVKVLWTIGGSLRSHDKHAAQGEPVEVTWPRGAQRVWVVATAGSDGRKLAGCWSRARARRIP